MTDLSSMLVGASIVEVGVRQAWPFVTFAPAEDGDPEIRLTIDTTFARDGATYFANGDPDSSLYGLLPLADLRVDDAEVAADGALHLRFSDACTLVVSGEGTEHTTQEVWWLTSRPPT